MDKSIIFGSTEASQLPTEDTPAVSPNDDDPTLVDTNGGGVPCSLPAVLDNVLKLTKHARDRMHLRQITKEQVVECYESARQKDSKMPSSSTVISSPDQPDISLVVTSDRKTVKTAIGTTKEALPYPAGQALTLRKLGLFQEMRTQLNIFVALQ